MKMRFITTTLWGLTAWAPGLVTAQEVGQVLSRSAIYQQVAIPRQTCTPTTGVVHSSSGAGALMGAIAGGAMGNAVGDGSGRALATMIGIMGGAMVGERIETPNQGPLQNQTTCATQTVYENRLVGYNVVYEYAGKQYNVQLPQDPGPTILLQISPASQSLRSEAPLPVPSAPIGTTGPNLVYMTAPIYRVHPNVYTQIDLNWGSYRPTVRHPGHNFAPHRGHGSRHSVHQDRRVWR